MAYAGLCESSLQDYTLPDWRLEIEREFFGTNVDEVIEVRGIVGIERDSAELVDFQVCGVRGLVLYSFLRDLRNNGFEITFSASGNAR
jgi:hypothetical protein